MTPIILNDTPIEEYEGIHVKREDLSAPPGAPPFSKIRGLVRHLEKLKKQGFIGAAYVETSVSMAGWGSGMGVRSSKYEMFNIQPGIQKAYPLT